MQYLSVPPPPHTVSLFFCTMSKELPNGKSVLIWKRVDSPPPPLHWRSDTLKCSPVCAAFCFFLKKTLGDPVTYLACDVSFDTQEFKFCASTVRQNMITAGYNQETCGFLFSPICQDFNSRPLTDLCSTESVLHSIRFHALYPG